MEKLYLCDENLEKYSKNKLSKFMTEDELIQHRKLQRQKYSRTAYLRKLEKEHKKKELTEK
jgi:hypothetical protein